ncbi:hypothetical protein HNR37_000288 [Desulfurispira natronophila]|uniref:Uncharacterized protein n=1 Tax=Desulfurispira natronophila TaxID=682562 RepID=A0A7W8DG35_9BACT|nr:hypothetical protein [Desulfurispira natronophila]
MANSKLTIIEGFQVTMSADLNHLRHLLLI